MNDNITKIASNRLARLWQRNINGRAFKRTESILAATMKLNFKNTYLSKNSFQGHLRNH